MKRQRNDHNRRRHDRNKFRRTANSTQHRKDLGNGLKGILISCTPRHENHAFREAVIMLDKHCENDANKLLAGTFDTAEEPKSNKEEENDPQKEQNNEGENTEKKLDDIDVSKALQAELKEIRDPKQKLFTRVDGGVNGCVFLRINRSDVDIEKVVECALRDARASGSPNSRHCIRIMPIHMTCYAKPGDAAKVAVDVVKKQFPPIVGEGKPVTYAISFRARLNTNAHREVFITEIAKAIDESEPRYKVNLTAPDVTLIVEVLKTSCCIGTFRHFYQLAKMNLREAASPSKPKEDQDKEKEKEEDESRSAEVTGDGERQSVVLSPDPGMGDVNHETGDANKGDGGFRADIKASGIDGEQNRKDEPASIYEGGAVDMQKVEAEARSDTLKDEDKSNDAREEEKPIDVKDVVQETPGIEDPVTEAK